MIKTFLRKKKSLPQRLLSVEETNKIIRSFKRNYSIKIEDIRFATIKKNIPNCPKQMEHLLGCPVEILFYGRNTCEVSILTDDKEYQGIKYISPKFINFIQENNEPLKEDIEIGEFILLTKNIMSNTEQIMGLEGERLVVLDINKNQELSYFVYSSLRKTAYYVSGNEFKRKRKRMNKYIR